MQFGSGWWFNDQKDGMERQMTQLAQLGLLSRFVGMLTDSRSFLSYTRHEYFRRILCQMIGRWVAAGEAPADIQLLGEMVRNICFNNARDYFAIELNPRPGEGMQYIKIHALDNVAVALADLAEGNEVTVDGQAVILRGRSLVAINSPYAILRKAKTSLNTVCQLAIRWWMLRRVSIFMLTTRVPI